MKVFIAGGGTGGHFYPASAVAESLREKGVTVFYFGTERGIEAVKEFPADHIELFNITGVRGKGLIKSLKASAGLLKTAARLIKVIKKEKPDSVLCFGGYTSLPLGLAAAVTGTPLFIHEQNSIPSYTNRILSRFAREIFITFEYTSRFFPERKTVLSGLPVRKSLKEELRVSPGDARKILGIEDSRTVLVFGGSQGARKLAETALKTAEIMDDIQFILIGGKHFPQPESLPENVRYFSYVDTMGIAYQASDVVVCRSGAGSTYEVMLSGRYPIFVPFPYAASNHQFFNALWLKEAGLAEIIEEKELSPELLAERISEAFKKDLEAVEKSLKSISIKNAGEIIIDRVINGLDR
ncbi:undecaprenyldiphospho-muramoylpentapeptide beta-N-acetylglucosaminyltransferase [Persephonella sp.]